MKELWKQVYDYKDYFVSNLGRIKSLNKVLKQQTNEKGYKKVNVRKNKKGKTYRVQVLVWDHFGNKERKLKEHIDHIDRNKENNSIENLQLLDNRLNNIKRRFKENNSSKYMGVHYDKYHKKYVSQIRINNKNVHLGKFDNEIDAALCYEKELLKIYSKNELKKSNYKFIPYHA